ncbi:hypothetical protein AEL96_03615 [Lactobacillus crispatus]|uniref:hypothetical protein n=1 Tax=Lactobacillus crispatus TaxID=47770 RepID=UPI000761988E|nr:hypothetical protein [Lactobacillus crispatus]KWU06446.1 hypothetical protein AEL96_03615 [Lactobacillus crispatus]
MIKIVENAEEKKDNSLKLNVNDTICCWNNYDVPFDVDKNYLMVTKSDDYEYLEKPYTLIALNDTDDQYRATNKNEILDKYFYSDLDDLARDIANSYDHIKKVDLVATVKESSNDED